MVPSNPMASPVESKRAGVRGKRPESCSHHPFFHISDSRRPAIKAVPKMGSGRSASPPSTIRSISLTSMQCVPYLISDHGRNTLAKPSTKAVSSGQLGLFILKNLVHHHQEDQGR